MNQDLEAAIEAGRRRMKQFEEKTSHEIDLFDQEVDQRHSKLSQKFSSFTEDLKPVSWPLWGVIMETSDGHKIYKEHLSMDTVTQYPRHFASGPSNFARDEDEPPSLGYYSPSPAARAIMEGRKWGVNKYMYDDEYVSNPPYGVIMRKPTKKPDCIEDFDHDKPKGKMEQVQPNTKLVSQYWRRKWKIPKDW